LDDQKKKEDNYYKHRWNNSNGEKGRTVVPYDKGNALVTDIPELYDIADVELYEFSNIPSPYMTPKLMFELARKIDEF